MDVMQVLKRGFELLIRDVLPLIVAALIVGGLTAVTLGVLGGPLLAGLYRMILLRIREDRVPQIGDVFYFEHFGNHVGAFYVLTILTSIGFVLLIVPGLYLATIWFYVFVLMVDREIGLSDALSQSKELVERVGLNAHFGVVLVLALLVTALGSFTRGLGTLVALPFYVACVIAAYELVSAQEESEPRTESAESDASA